MPWLFRSASCLPSYSFLIEPIWAQFEALIPPVIDDHPFGGHRPRIADRVVFDKLVQVLVLGTAYVKIADSTCDSGKTRELLSTLGCAWVISTKGTPLQTGARWVVERTNSCHTRRFRKLQICTERRTRVIDAFIALAAAIITTRRLIREAWTRYRWDTRPTRTMTHRRDLIRLVVNAVREPAVVRATE
ncbi:hypothetical protein [Frondihabitans sp. PAMC 28766]|uniref:hypothetical protein n=1 Tax=Frondihabitans sp. PAMC 28766 TaxID=1795630 RepID=UPI001EF60837|nr:hypothetical protein [Frondihabitans sp. PAMC 28766]